GLKAIFADPDNGNYDLANTVEGAQIEALGAGMISPITCFLGKPSYEEGANLIRNNQVLSINACRNPCQQNSIRINATFDINPINDRQIKLEWNIAEQQNIDHYELQKATGNSVFKRIGTIRVSADSIYSFIDNIQAGIPYQYRLAIIPLGVGKCYSDPRQIKINDDKAFTIYPNPSSGKMQLSMNGYIGKASFIISNSDGQPILKKEIFSLYSTQSLDLSNYPKGLYFLKMETSKGVSVQKFVLQ
ncbi:MAG: T9SS type A sorting domain-containing protein, partial [Ginsengibacter sp.]